MLNSGNICAKLDIVRQDIELPFAAMYKAQFELQKRVNSLPIAGRTAKESAKQAIYWYYCISDELFELLDWLEVPNYVEKEAFMEAIDIVHFVFNLGLELDIKAVDIEAICKNEAILATPAKQQPTIAAILPIVISLQASILNCISTLPWKTWRAYNNIQDICSIHAGARPMYWRVLQQTMRLCYALGMTTENIIDYYFAKNNENHARQDRGY